MKFTGHPSTHGHHINPYTCGSGQRMHWACSGFSGGYDTYTCGCCCHDNEQELAEQERAIVQRLQARPT